MFRYRCHNCGNETPLMEEQTNLLCTKCGSPTDSIYGKELLPGGTRLGDFEIVRLVGSGSSGNVYLANQISMRRSAAVKVLYRYLTDNNKSAVEQFFEEVRIHGQIQHSSIVCAFSSGEENGLYYLAMQFIAGNTLEEYLSQGRISQEQALPIVETIAETLDYVWGKYHFCHRDIKPGNIMINEDGQPVLLDFGAALLSGDSSIRNGQIEGSPFYMSPEQARGENLSFSSDLYSLGATLYQMLTGVPPYESPDGDMQKVLQMQCFSPFPLPEQRVPGLALPADLVACIQKMMAKTPAERYGSWKECIEALKKIGRPPSHKGAKMKLKSHANSGKNRSAYIKPKKKFSATMLNILLICVLGCCGAVFVLAKNNNTRAENALKNALTAFKNAMEKGTDPEHAVKLFREAKRMTNKFGVKNTTLEEVEEACQTKGRELEMLQTENSFAEELHSKVLTVLKGIAGDRETAYTLHKKNEPFMPVMEEARKKLDLLDAELQKHKFVRPLNRKGLSMDIEQIAAERKQLTIMEEDFKKEEKKNEEKKNEQDAGSVSPIQTENAEPEEKVEKTPEQIQAEEEEKRRAEEEEKRFAEEAEKQRLAEEKRKEEEEANKKLLEKYTGQIDKEKNRIAQELIILVRRQNFISARELLNFPDCLVTNEPVLKDMELDMHKWMDYLRSMMDDAEMILKSIPDDVKRAKAIASFPDIDKQVRYHAFLLCGYFPQAEKLKPSKDGPLIELLAKAYLTPRIMRAVKNSRTGRPLELNSLRKDYGDYNLYRELEENLGGRKK